MSRTVTVQIGLKIRVLRKHIARAYRLDARRCAIADAILDMDEDILWANVTKNEIRWARRSTDMIEKYRTPAEARLFIDAFDRGEAEPTSFELGMNDNPRIVPRNLHQREQADEIARREFVRKTTGVDPRDIPRSELPVFDSNGEAIVGRSPVVIQKEARKGLRPQAPSRLTVREKVAAYAQSAKRKPKPIQQYAKREIESTRG